jgi:hypothetical protein
VKDGICARIAAKMRIVKADSQRIGQTYATIICLVEAAAGKEVAQKRSHAP